MKKIVELKEEDVVDGMVEDTLRDINKIFYNALGGISVLYVAMLIFSMILIESNLHRIFAVIMLTALFIFSILALKSYTIIQLGMLKNIIQIKNTEDIKNGSTNNGKEYKNTSDSTDEVTT